MDAMKTGRELESSRSSRDEEDRPLDLLVPGDGGTPALRGVRSTQGAFILRVACEREAGIFHFVRGRTGGGGKRKTYDG
jgi:hypothetical protein